MPTKNPRRPANKDATPHARAGAKRQMARPGTMAEQAAFLARFAVIGVITGAAKDVGIDRQRHYEWLDDPEKYPDYRKCFEDAHEQACDRLEAEATRRAVDGWDEPVYGSGGKDVGTVEVGVVRKYSDRMLEILLKARRPERFRERHDLTSGGEKMAAGVLVVPGVATGDDWTAAAGAQQKALEEHARAAGESADPK